MTTLIILWLILGIILTAVVRAKDGPMRILIYPVCVLALPIIIPLAIIATLFDCRI